MVLLISIAQTHTPIHRPTASVISFNCELVTVPSRFMNRSRAKDLTCVQSTELILERPLSLVSWREIKNIICSWWALYSLTGTTMRMGIFSISLMLRTTAGRVF